MATAAWSATRRHIFRRVPLILAFFGTLLVLVCGSAGAAPFRIGLEDPGFGSSATPVEARDAYEALRVTHPSVMRTGIYWARIAPDGDAPPPGFRPADPRDPHYRWSDLDSVIRSAALQHQQVVVDILGAPRWAEGPGTPGPGATEGSWNPIVSDYSAFLHAVALRYSGHFEGLPRITYWEPWDEPNLPYWFSAPHPVSAYRTILNTAYSVLKAVRKDNVVLFGGLAPVKPTPESFTPMDFAADVLCLRRVGYDFRANPSCHSRTNFDVFGIHSYTLGATPTMRAAIPGDVFAGDMGEVQNLVREVDRLHGGNRKIWVTEFAWFTNPPNPRLGDSAPSAARYVAYSMYEMWRSGVTLVSWQGLTDLPPSSSDAGRGLFTAAGRPKLVLRAFAFPFIASVQRGRGFVWGRAPVRYRARVIVQRSVGNRWRTVALRRTGPHGVFSAGFKAGANGLYRAKVVGGAVSLAYNSVPIPPRYTRAINFG